MSERKTPKTRQAKERASAPEKNSPHTPLERAGPWGTQFTRRRMKPNPTLQRKREVRTIDHLQRPRVQAHYPAGHPAHSHDPGRQAGYARRSDPAAMATAQDSEAPSSQPGAGPLAVAPEGDASQGQGLQIPALGNLAEALRLLKETMDDVNKQLLSGITEMIAATQASARVALPAILNLKSEVAALQTQVAQFQSVSASNSQLYTNPGAH